MDAERVGRPAEDGEVEDQAVVSVLEALLESITLAEQNEDVPAKLSDAQKRDPAHMDKDPPTEGEPATTAEVEFQLPTPELHPDSHDLPSAGHELSPDEQAIMMDLSCSEILADKASPLTDDDNTRGIEVLEMELEEVDTTTTTASTADQKVKEVTEASQNVESDPSASLSKVQENEAEIPTSSTPSGPSTPKPRSVPIRTVKSAPMLRRRRRRRHMTRQRQTSTGSGMKRNAITPLGKRLVKKDGEGHSGNDKASPRKIVRRRKVGSSKKGKNAAPQEENPERPIITPKLSILSTALQMYDGLIYRIGDIIQLNGDDGLLYYAQILRFLVDEYCEKFIIIRWLVPREGESIKHHHSTEFNPAFFAQGPCQDEPINMEDITFVMRAPRDFGPGLLEPTFNKCGELSIVFNRNIPENTETSSLHCKL